MRRLLTSLIVCLACAPSLAAADEDAGRLLRDVLDERIAAGERIIYSSDLVSDGMVVRESPIGDTSLQHLESLLQPFGLAVRTGPSGEWLVVPAPGAGAAPAPTAPAAAAPAPIPEIVVTSSLHRLRYSEPVTHTRLDRELATRIPTVAEEPVRLTDRLPGTASGGVSTRNHVRGGEVSEVLFLLDGLRLYEPYHLKQFQAIATIVNPAAIDSMDFYTGAYPARYGDRMSGVLEIDLREPPTATETELSLSFFNASAMSAGRFGDSGDWLVSARRGNLDLVVDAIEPEYGSPDYHDLLSHVGWEFGPRAVVSANLLFSKDKLSLFDPDRGESATAAYKNEVYWLKWLADWSDAWQSETIAAYSDISNRRSGTLDLPGIVSGQLDEQNEFRVLELRQDWQWVPSSKWMLRFGANLKRLDADYRFSSQQVISAPFDGILDNAPASYRDFTADPAGAQYAAYADLRWRLLPPLVLELGLRWDQQTYTTAKDDTQLGPRAALLFEAGERTSLRFGWGQYYQAQEINELQLADGLDAFFPAQRAEHFVLNVEHRFPNHVDVAISAYRKRFRELRPRFENSFNTLTLLPEIQFDRVEVDAPSAEAIGVEASLTQGSGTDDLFWWLSYAWARVEDRMPGGDVLRSWDQEHTLKAGLSWRWRDWNFSTAAEVHTGWPRTELVGTMTPGPDGDELALAVTPRNAAHYGRFQSLDVRVSRDFPLKRGRLTTFLEVSNLANRENACCTEYSLADDGSLLGEQAHWLPLVPSLGVVWRF